MSIQQQGDALIRKYRHKLGPTLVEQWENMSQVSCRYTLPELYQGVLEAKLKMMINVVHNQDEGLLALEETMRQQMDPGGNRYWRHVTIRATKGANLQEFIDYINDRTTSKKILSAKYAFETHTNSGPDNLHCHMLLTFKNQDYCKPSKIKVLFPGIESAMLEVSAHGTYESTLAYISGKKREEKQEHVEKDIEWRAENGIENLYEK